MLATPNSRGIYTQWDGKFRLKFIDSRGAKLFGLFLGIAFWFAGGLSVRAEEAAPTDNALFQKRAEKAFLAAKARFEAETNNAEAVWQFGRACFDFADLAPSDGKREEIANQGIAACRRWLETDPKSVEGHYYLGMNLGELAETKTLGALKLVKEMESEFILVLKANPKLDNAGPDRNLGLLYRDAPGWPASIGNRAKARQHLQQAAILTPDFPENLLNLVEGELKWGDTSKAVRDLKSLTDILPKAQQKYTGEQWEPAWVDWQKRIDGARKKVSTETKAPASPRDKTGP
jgi:hypothetical protein